MAILQGGGSYLPGTTLDTFQLNLRNGGLRLKNVSGTSLEVRNSNDTAYVNFKALGGTFTSDLNVEGNLNVLGNTTTITTQDISVTDRSITLANTNTPDDTTANGGGFIIKGTTDKNFLWDSFLSSFSSSESLNLLAGKSYKINGINVLSSTALGSGILTSSLTSVGIINSGTWQGAVISPNYGGTGLNTLGTALQQLRVNAGGTALEYFTPASSTKSITSEATVSTNINLVVGTGYTVNSSSTVTLTLPVTANNQDIIRIINIGTGKVVVGQNANQSIVANDSPSTTIGTTVGTGGSLETGDGVGTGRYTQIDLIYVGANIWKANHDGAINFI